ncbi:20007_t:CDS:2, partial [Dentiscutata erythropus]
MVVVLPVVLNEAVHSQMMLVRTYYFTAYQNLFINSFRFLQPTELIEIQNYRLQL